jgi:hypothetical protein
MVRIRFENIRYFLCYDPVPFFTIRISCSNFAWPCISLSSRTRSVPQVIIISGGLPGYTGASWSRSIFPAPVDSVSKSVALRSAKNLRVNTASGHGVRTVDVETNLAELLAVCEVLIEICFLRLLMSHLAYLIVDSTSLHPYSTLFCLWIQLLNRFHFI